MTEIYPNLQRVVIVKRPARYDSQIKAHLSVYGNQVLDSLCRNVGNKIVIGDQDLFCDGELRIARFGSPNSQNYDGIHMKGKLGIQHMKETFINMLTGIFSHLKKPVILMQ